MPLRKKPAAPMATVITIMLIKVTKLKLYFMSFTLLKSGIYVCGFFKGPIRPLLRKVIKHSVCAVVELTLPLNE